MEYPNWFEQSAKENFEFVLKDLAGKPDLKFLQIGAFTGDASVWMLDNILTDPSSGLTDVDTWQGSEEDVHKGMDFEDVFNTYIEKTSGRNRLYARCTSADFIMKKSMFSPTDYYDFIYIDGDHTSSGVLSDATMAFYYLKPGGIMAFDDYTWLADNGLEIDSPKPAINFFYWANQRELETILVNTQFWVKKI